MDVAEDEFLAAVEALLKGLPLAPAPKSVGVAEPAQAADLPAIVLSLERASRLGSGLGRRNELVTGALPVTATIDLANPVLADGADRPPFNLLSPNRRVLTLHHGGLVRADGTSGPLAAVDIQVTVAGVARPVVEGVPTGQQVAVDPLVGQLRFAAPLPAAGNVAATYRLGQWERRTVRLSGVIRLDVCAAEADDVRGLSHAVTAALLEPAAAPAFPRLLSIRLSELGAIGARDPAAANARRRTARMSFDFEHQIDRAESSGGIIRTIPIDAEPEPVAIA